MRSHLAWLVFAMGLSACTHTLVAAERDACPEQRGIGIIGMSIDQRARPDGAAELFVDRIVPEGPAARAGLHPGDTIVGIEGTPSRGMSVGDAARRLRGPVDAAVGLDIDRGGRTWRVIITRVAPSELWSGEASASAARRPEAVRASDVAPVDPSTVPCRR
jgi:C-terminal processing protease CtpA/Prc